MLGFREDRKKREEEMLGVDRKLKTKKVLVDATMPGSETEKYISLSKIGEEVDNINAKLQGVFGSPSLVLSYKSQQPLQVLGEVIVEKQQRDVRTKKLKLLKKVNIAGRKAACSIVDGAVSPNSRVLLILADFLNERLVVISTEYNVTFYQLSSQPWGITYIADTEIAVSLRDEQVKFFTVGEGISCTNGKSFKVSGEPFGIRYLKSVRSLIIAVRKVPGFLLEFWSLDGKVLRTIASHDYNIDYMTLTTNEKILYSSSQKHLVCMLEPDGTVLKSFQYVDDNMLGPFGIASDANETIYVCGKSCLRTVSQEGKWEQILARENGFAPQSLLVCDKTKRLFVGQAQGQTFVDLLVFQL